MSIESVKYKLIMSLVLLGTMLMLSNELNIIKGRDSHHTVYAQTTPGATIVIHPHMEEMRETIPNPVHNIGVRVATSCQSTQCNWDSASTWQNGAVPNLNTRVIIDGNVRIRNQNAVARSIGVYPGGKLTFSPNANTRLRTADLLVLDGGTLEIGTVNNPIGDNYNAEVSFRDISFDNNDTDKHLRGLLAFDGTVRIVGRTVNDAFLRTAVEPTQGNNQIVLMQSAQNAGWRVGDSVVIPNSKQCPVASYWRATDIPCSNEEVQTEDRTINTISSDGLTITLNQGLSYDHPGARSHTGSLDFTPHVINKSRNVILRSENPNGVRGHLLFHGRADVDMRYASVESLGRTDIRDLDADSGLDTVNQKGRYPVHAHHLIGPVNPQSNGYQFTFIGNVVDFGAENEDQDRKWGISIHESHYGLIENNVVDYASGAAVVTESGSETGNLFRENFAVRVVGGVADNEKARLDDKADDGSKQGRAGVGFWFNGGGGNQYEGNVAAAIFECEFCYGFKFDNMYSDELRFPTEQGNDPHMGGGETVDPYSVGINHFLDNETYAVPNGLTMWWYCSRGASHRDNCSSYIESFNVWHHHRWGIFWYETNNFTLDNFVLRGDPSVLTNQYEDVQGINFADYSSRNAVIRNADIQNVRTGINMSSFRDDWNVTGADVGFSTVEDSYIVASDGIDIWPPFSVNASNNNTLPPQTTILTNVHFDYPDVSPNGQGEGYIIMRDTETAGFDGSRPTQLDLTLRNDVWVYNYNSAPGVDGDDLYMIPDYHSTGRCDNSIGNCASQITANYNDIDRGYIYPLRDGNVPEEPPSSGDDLITNGTFDTATDPWYGYSASYTHQVELDNGQLKLSHNDPSGAQLYQTIGQVAAGKTYKLTFDIRSNQNNTPIELFLREIGPNYDDLTDRETIIANTGTQSVEVLLTADSTYADALVMFELNGTQTIWVDNVSLVEVTGTPTYTPTPTQTPTQTPSPTPTQTPTPQTPPPVGNSYDIYTDSLASGWVDWSWGVNEIDLSNTEQVASGSYAIKADLQQWGGFSLGWNNSTINTSDYVAVQFDVRSVGTQQLLARPAGLDDKEYGFSATSQWQTVTMPLDGIDELFYRFDIYSAGGDPVAFWVDNIRLVGETADSSPLAIQATSLTTYNNRGSVDPGQSVSNLHDLDQTGGDNDWNKFVQFLSTETKYAGYRSYYLPDDVDRDNLGTLQVDFNYRGPANDTQRWLWYLYNWTESRWVYIGDNRNMTAWSDWETFTFIPLGEPADYVNPTTREIRVRHQSNNTADNMHLDYEAVVVREAGSTQLLSPFRMDTHSNNTWGGTTGDGQVVGNLHVQDQSGADDDWDQYVEFISDTERYSGYRRYNLPVGVDPDDIVSFKVHANYRGPDRTVQVWRWQLYKWATDTEPAKWVTIGSNWYAPAWEWTPLMFNAYRTLGEYDFADYVHPNNRLMFLRVYSNNTADNMNLDYEAIEFGIAD